MKSDTIEKIMSKGQEADVKITPEIMMDSSLLYLIRVNKKEVMFFNSEEQAILGVDSLAAQLAKELQSPTVEVYRKDFQEGNKTILSVKELGSFYNSGVYKVKEIDYIPVGHGNIIKGRHELNINLSE